MPLVSQSLNNLAAGVFVGCALIAGLVLGRAVVLPLVFATILAFILSPIVAWMASRLLPRPVATGITMALLIALVALSSWAFSSQLLSLTADLGTYQENIVRKVRAVASTNSADGAIQKATKSINAIEEGIKRELGVPGDQKGQGVAATASGGGSATTSVLDTVLALTSPFAQAGLTLLLTLFMLLGSHDLRDRVVRLMGTDNMSATTAALSDAGERLSRLFLTLTALNAGFGFIVFALLFLIGVPNALLWGAVAFLMRFVPYVGSLLATVPPTLLALAVDPGWSMAIATLAIFAIGESLLGHVLEPMLLGRSVGLSPLAMVLSAAFWTAVWGPIGLIIAAPITMTLAMLGRYVPRLEFLSVMLGDGAVLSSAEKVYHRLLGDDGLAASAEIATAMPDAKPDAIADAIVLPALRLAARDFRLSVLDEEQLRGIETAMKEVLETLADPDTHPPTAGGGAGCLIVPARGPLDAMAGALIAQIVREMAGLENVVVSKASGLMALSSARSLYAAAPPQIVIVSTVGGLDGGHLALLTARAERDFPAARILACAWSDRQASEAAAAQLSNRTTAFWSLKAVVEALSLSAPAGNRKAAERSNTAEADLTVGAIRSA